ncbi:hypothetical protein [Treponema sp.]|uniref:hypothetical protein n=1 Tax=Treponema sp. TaxID=166 RepID=UPI0025DB6266|nr:hypothetical protein [Treponema sp.]MCR5217158.1 hypothetical protein [Treponema sp.]
MFYLYIMTLNSRNRILIFINVITILFFLSNVLFYIFYAARNLITFPEGDIVRNVYIFSFDRFTSPDITPTCLSILVFSFSAAIESFLLLRIFEKTQALEVVFFIVFIIAIFMEQQRLYLASMPDIQGNRFSLEVITRLTVSSRILAPLSLLFSTVFNEWDQRQNILRNVLILVLISTIMGVFYPLNTEIRTSILTLGWGFSPILSAVRVILVLASLTVPAWNAFSKGSSDYIRVMIGLLILSTGYFILCGSDNYISFISGSAFFAFGNVFYMSALHNLYKWR